MCQFLLDAGAGISPAPPAGLQWPAPSHGGAEGAGPAMGKGNRNQGGENSLQPPLNQGNHDTLKGPPSSTLSLPTCGTSGDQELQERRKTDEWQSLESEGHEQRSHCLLHHFTTQTFPSQVEMSKAVSLELIYHGVTTYPCPQRNWGNHCNYPTGYYPNKYGDLSSGYKPNIQGKIISSQKVTHFKEGKNINTNNIIN